MKRSYVAALMIGSMLTVLFLDDTLVFSDAQKDSKCVVGRDPLTCFGVGASACYAEPDALCRGTVKCNFCDSDAALPNMYCVYWEGSMCTPTGPPVFCKANSDDILGQCVKGSYCACTNLTKIGTCDGSEDFAPCKN